MKNEIFDNMLSRYDLTTEQQKRNAIFEVNQQVILAGLYAGGFFESAAFYGGTCLRIFHGLQRFSEDMDFSLLTQDDKFDFTKYFPAIVDAFTMVGREVEIKKKDKRNFGKVESAFLKDNTDVYDVTFQTGKSNPSTVILIHSLIILRSTLSSTNRHKSGPGTRFHRPYYPIHHS